MDITDYIIKSSETAVYPNQGTMGGLDYVLSGLAGEAGEVMEILKKVIRDSGGIIPDIDRITKEIGDMLWYWSQIMVETQGKFEDEFDVDQMQKEVFEKTGGISLSFDDPNLVRQLTLLMKHFYSCYGEICEKFIAIDSNASYTVATKQIAELNVEIIKIISVFLSTIGVNLSHAMQTNLDKLGARMAAGKIRGSGEELCDR